MKDISHNLEKLKQLLKEIKEKGKSYCVTITSMGNLLYVLNDGINFYVLLVPNKKFSQNISKQLLQIEGWNEKFPLTNYHKIFDLNSFELILFEIEKIFKEILRIPEKRDWRFKTNSGMMIVKANEISLDAETRREKNKRQANSILRRFIKTLLFPFTSNLNISIFTTFILTIIILFKSETNNETFDIKFLIIILGLGLLIYTVLQLRQPDKK